MSEKEKNIYISNYVHIEMTRLESLQFQLLIYIEAIILSDLHRLSNVHT